MSNLPDTPERAQQKLALQMAMGASLLATAGFATAETGERIPGRVSCVAS